MLNTQLKLTKYLLDRKTHVSKEKCPPFPFINQKHPFINNLMQVTFYRKQVNIISLILKSLWRRETVS